MARGAWGAEPRQRAKRVNTSRMAWRGAPAPDPLKSLGGLLSGWGQRPQRACPRKGAFLPTALHSWGALRQNEAGPAVGGTRGDAARGMEAREGSPRLRGGARAEMSKRPRAMRERDADRARRSDQRERRSARQGARQPKGKEGLAPTTALLATARGRVAIQEPPLEAGGPSRLYTTAKLTLGPPPR